MKRTPFSYSIIKYVHDPAAGECLNVGVLLYSKEERYARVRVETHYQRLSEAFRDFDGERYRKALRQLDAAVDRLHEEVRTTLTGLMESPADVAALGARIWPDPELSLRLSAPLAGVAADLEVALDQLFKRMVLSQGLAQTDERRSDEDVWAKYREPLERVHVVGALRPRKIVSKEVELKFDHAFKNENWHVLRPLSMDHARGKSMLRKAATWVGYGTSLQGARDLGSIYFLLGPPQVQSQRVAYEKAKAFLDRVPIDHEIVEEDDADDFASHLESELRRHGLLEEEDSK